MYGNAVNMCGVWAETAMPLDELQGLRAIPEVVTSTVFYDSADRDVVAAWAAGAGAECAAFRSMLSGYISRRRAAPPPGDTLHDQGRRAFLDSLAGLL